MGTRTVCAPDGHSGRPVRRYIALAGATSLIAMAGVAFAAPTDMGQLRLQLGQTNYPAQGHEPRIVVDGKAADGRILFIPGAANSTAGSDFQRIVKSGKCGYGVASEDPRLAVLTGFFGEAEAGLGLGPDSIGVPINNGTGCFRISATNHANVRFSLGEDVRAWGGNAFWKLDIDLELKGTGAAFELDVYRGPIPADPTSRVPFRTYFLKSGAVPSSGPELNTSYCDLGADSNADAGPRDNCQWTITPPQGEDFLGDQFILRATTAEGSLEGGGDQPDGVKAYAKNTVIYLTNAIFGNLRCGESTPTLGDGVNSAQCTATAVDTGDSCPSVGYVLRDLPNASGNTSGCEFKLDKTNGQFVGYMDVVFEKEPRKEIAGKDLNNLNILVTTDAPLTRIIFPGDTDGFTPQRCGGTVTGSEGNKNLTIYEVLTSTQEWVKDQVLSTTPLEWACILVHREDYVKREPSAAEQMQISERILFWGDIGWSRF